ncbi:MAG: hypothetical protein ACJ0AN_01410 [Alphaproteobacteria bacterium]|uniref:Uncharacterized protein n=1 Tax=PS1 clade bacterium TaxID=2175152 RepID=A0A368DQG8_9PROT|nr:hypothetical protein [Rhodobiaceae bacterium]OUT74240.1 MAG: hypothetical protein CBB85_04045 [Rhizobiales bacterium TMED25]RCL73566.1 MAG: hypothetical protein DBW71_03555 [PS1 clade bacterium]|tara:strand:+ start:4216 stop:4428 length:213 start_codon:yes stop_codon:yes gene_type:complete
MGKEYIKEILLNGLNSGLSYDIESFFQYYYKSDNKIFQKDVENIKVSLMDANIQSTLDKSISRYTENICY